MLYHDIVVEATRTMNEDARKSFGFFSMDFGSNVELGLDQIEEIVSCVVRKL